MIGLSILNLKHTTNESSKGEPIFQSQPTPNKASKFIQMIKASSPQMQQKFFRAWAIHKLPVEKKELLMRRFLFRFFTSAASQPVVRPQSQGDLENPSPLINSLDLANYPAKKSHVKAQAAHLNLAKDPPLKFFKNPDQPKVEPKQHSTQKQESLCTRLICAIGLFAVRFFDNLVWVLTCGRFKPAKID